MLREHREEVGLLHPKSPDGDRTCKAEAQRQVEPPGAAAPSSEEPSTKLVPGMQKEADGHIPMIE